MAEQTTFTCDRCGAVKGAANHWFRVVHNGDVTVSRWEDGPHKGIQRHICGDKCLLAEVQEFANGKAVADTRRRLEIPGMAMEEK